MLVRIAQLAQPSPDPGHSGTRFANHLQALVPRQPAGLHCLQEQAFEIPAVGGPIRIDPAAAAVQGGTRLSATHRS